MRERKKTADADPQKHLMLHIFPFWRFIILLQETYSQRKGYNAGLNICGQFRCTCLYIALNEKHSKTQTQFITSSGVHKSILFRAGSTKITGLETCILPVDLEGRAVTDIFSLFLMGLVEN